MIYNVLSVNHILLRKDVIYIIYKHTIRYIVFNLKVIYIIYKHTIRYIVFNLQKNPIDS
jgi:sRNA-binding regulator protein Hfq